MLVAAVWRSVTTTFVCFGFDHLTSRSVHVLDVHAIGKNTVYDLKYNKTQKIESFVTDNEVQWVQKKTMLQGGDSDREEEKEMVIEGNMSVTYTVLFIEFRAAAKSE